MFSSCLFIFPLNLRFLNSNLLSYSQTTERNFSELIISMHYVSLPFFTPALHAHEVPNTVLDTGTAVERRKTRAFFLPSWSFCCGGRRIPQSHVESQQWCTAEAQGLWEIVRHSDPGKVGGNVLWKLQVSGIKEKQVRNYFVLDTILCEAFFHERIQLILTPSREHKEGSPIYRWGH